MITTEERSQQVNRKNVHGGAFGVSMVVQCHTQTTTKTRNQFRGVRCSLAGRGASAHAVGGPLPICIATSTFLKWALIMLRFNWSESSLFSNACLSRWVLAGQPRVRTANSNQKSSACCAAHMEGHSVHHPPRFIQISALLWYSTSRLVYTLENVSASLAQPTRAWDRHNSSRWCGVASRRF